MKYGFVVDFTGEKQVYGEEALRNGLIDEYHVGNSFVVFQNNGTTVINICPSDTTIAQWQGFVLAPGDSTNPGGHFMWDSAANHGSLGNMRAFVHGGGAGKLSILVI